MEIPQITCNRCGHTWIPRIPDPLKCPRCKNLLKNWKETGAQPSTAAPAATPGLTGDDL